MEKTVGDALLGILLIGLFAGCSMSDKGRSPPLDSAGTPAALPGEPPSRTGNPPSYEVFGKRYYVSGTSEGYWERGIASWYGDDFHGKNTSSGSPFDMHVLTAAHKSLPIPTYVQVTHLGNGRSIVVKVNDRGPFIDERIIDLSYAAAAELDMLETGTAEVEVAALPPYQYLPGFAPAIPQQTLALDAMDAPALPPAEPGIRQAAYQPPASGAAQADEQSPPSLEPTAMTAEAIALYLQVGAFSERHNAEQLQERLISRFGQAVRIDSSAGYLHKVQIGPFNTTIEAESVAVELAAFGIDKSHAVLE
jgi:rare lipoprotein A